MTTSAPILSLALPRPARKNQPGAKILRARKELYPRPKIEGLDRRPRLASNLGLDLVRIPVAVESGAGPAGFCRYEARSFRLVGLHSVRLVLEASICVMCGMSILPI